jgi:hypothetical protein
MEKELGKIKESGIGTSKWTIKRFLDEAAFKEDKPYNVSEIDGNLLLNEGIALLLDLLIGAGGTVYSNANAYIGVGDSATAAVATQTALQASTNKAFKAMESSYPSRANQTLTFRSVFGSSDGNFSWQEFTIVNANSDSGTNLNRKVSDQGTKVSGQVWTVDVALTIT